MKPLAAPLDKPPGTEILLPRREEVDDDTSLLSREDFVSWLTVKVREREPAAAVRFGDGEARLLMADPNDQPLMSAIFHALNRETGRAFSAEEVLELKELMGLAFDRADVLGIRFSHRFLREHRWWMTRLAAHYSERRSAGRAPAALASCLLGHDTLEALPELLTGRRMSAISCRDLAPILESRLGSRDAIVYQVPSQFAVRDVDGPYESTMHDISIWPEVHSRLRRELTVRERGEVFLVGAGFFGKDLCILIRERGGIAIDMGSALDKIAGKVTRGPKRRVLDFYAGGMPPDEIAAQLDRLYGVQVKGERIAREIREATDGEITAWQTRPLQKAYVELSLEAIAVELTEDGATRQRTCHVGVGTAEDGHREPVGIWWSDMGDAGAPPRALHELRQRGMPQGPPRSADRWDGLAAVRNAIENHGPFSDEGAATTLIYLASRRAERSPSGTQR